MDNARFGIPAIPFCMACVISPRRGRNSMWDFFGSDVGKVALGGLIAFAGQLVASLLGWAKEARFAASKRRKDAEYLAMRLVLVFDDLTGACYNAVHDPLIEDVEGISSSTVDDPKLSLPTDGDYKALPPRLMFDIMSMPNRLEGIMGGLASVADISGPPDFQEYFEYRREQWSRLGLKALELIDALCRRYKIPLPERPQHYTPRQSFLDELAETERDTQKRNEATNQLIEALERKREIPSEPT
jgi:hypothetical protein